MLLDAAGSCGEEADQEQQQVEVAACAIEEVAEVERARQREIAAYLSAASFPMDLLDGPGGEPAINSDPTLNALCQLGALRLNCDRSFISLIDRSYQWVVAEITRTHSICEMKWENDDRIFLGVAKLEACWGVCPTTMKAFIDETGEWIKHGPNIIANNTRYIVNDFTTEPDYQNRSYVVGFPYFRSYCEVPLVSPLGYVLSYCVVHNDLKEFDETAVEILNDIAKSIMVYLDGVRTKQNRQRSEQLIAGLSTFIATDPSTSVSQQRFPEPPAHTRPPAPERTASLDPTESSGSSVTGSTDSAKQLRSGRRPNMALASSIASSVSGPTLHRGDSLETTLTSLGDESSQGLAGQPAAAEQAVAHDAEERGPSTPISAGSNVPEQQGSGFISSANIKSAFFRAATTIRTSMGLDGLAFLDAAPTAFVDYSDQSPVHDAEGPSPEAAGPFCAAIVQSSVDQGGASTPNSTQSRLPEAMLQRFIRKYPNGHIFSADDLGPIGESYAPGKPYPGLRADRGNRRLHEDMTTLFQSFPAAKYIIFLPLWHFQRECWYAATLGWVTDPTTAIEVTDITLLSAFGNSVMAEISRLEAMAASRAKSSFVSSISHELRSPLHGILASSELLRASISDPSLLSTLDMLDSCGRTLLDTFNNLLEHAITVRDGLEGTPKATAPVAKPVMTDLGELVQDVVDAVHFSHLSERAFQSSLTAASDGSYSARPSNDQTSGLNRPLLIMLDIEKRSWELPVDAGVWNRFVMNIFGNALKYTKAGRIEVSLRMLQKADAAGLSNYVCLRVEDTGRGMSADYLKYRLFTPFAQEDSYAPGIGLGLSIVQQLAKGLGGTIDVKSSVGVGTVVEICLPAAHEIAPPTAIESTPLRSTFDEQLYGRTLCLVTAEAYRRLTKTTSGTNDKPDRSAVVERAIRASACEFWGMKLVVASDASLPRADIYVLDSECFRDLVQDGVGNAVVFLPSVSPLLLLCSGAGAPVCSSLDGIKNYVHLHHPISPKKVRSAISALNASWGKDLGVVTSDGPPLAPIRVPPVPAPQKTFLAGGAEATKEGATPGITAGLPPPKQTTLHLLLVDDNPINIKILETTVRRLKHTFASAYDGLEAVQLYKKALDEQRPFDMVWMDLQMPKMDGFEAIREIRDLEISVGSKACSMIALTGLSSDEHRNQAMASGASDFLTKPVKMGIIKGMLDDQLQKRDV